MSRIHAVPALASWRVALCVVGVMLCASQALAADRAGTSDARVTYKRDRAACISGKGGEDRATCLREAGAALQAAKGGGLTDDEAQFERNRLARCARQPPEDRGYCIRRMNGEGTISGSVESGGIYRELVTPVDPAKHK